MLVLNIGRNERKSKNFNAREQHRQPTKSAQRNSSPKSRSGEVQIGEIKAVSRGSPEGTLKLFGIKWLLGYKQLFSFSFSLCIPPQPDKLCEHFGTLRLPVKVSSPYCLNPLITFCWCSCRDLIGLVLAFNHLPIPICFAGFDLLPFAVGIEELKAILSEREQNGIAADDRRDQGSYVAFSHR